MRYLSVHASRLYHHVIQYYKTMVGEKRYQPAVYTELQMVLY